jgi:hypothetical protein
MEFSGGWGLGWTGENKGRFLCPEQRVSGVRETLSETALRLRSAEVALGDGQSSRQLRSGWARVGHAIFILLHATGSP